MIRSLLACVALITVTGVIPKAPFRINTFAVGKPARGLAANGKPTVVVAFASWCVGCIDEFPELMRDYARFKDRVTFIGVDYLDSPKAGQATVEKYHIPFQVVMDEERANLPPADTTTHTVHEVENLRLTGVTPSMLRTMKPFSGLTPTLAAKLQDVVRYCRIHSDSECTQYGSARGIFIGSATASPLPESSPSASTRAADGLLSLPHLFVIDAQGIVRAEVTGYTTGRDDIRASLAKIGIT